MCERGLSSWPRLKSAGARYDAARLVRGSNKMLSDLAPLEMSAPEPADARPSRVGSAQTPVRLAQLLPVRSREADTCAGADGDERRPDTAFLPRSLIFLPRILCFLLFSGTCVRCGPAAAAAETDLCCPDARCAADTTKSMCDDDVGRGRKPSTPKCPLTALVSHSVSVGSPGKHTDVQHNIFSATRLQKSSRKSAPRKQNERDETLRSVMMLGKT